MSRKIIHCDRDCLYAAIEVRDDPKVRGPVLPVLIEGLAVRVRRAEAR